MLSQQYVCLTSTDSYVEPLLMRVLETDVLGVHCGKIEVDSISSSCGKQKGDRFKLSIPYAGQNLTWDVLFDSQSPELGPDFIFNDDTFLADTDVDVLSEKLPSLAKWNPNDKEALLNVLMELLSCYKQHQIQLLQRQTRLILEYNMITKCEEVELENIEMILSPCGPKPTEAKFVIKFQIDVSQLQNIIYDSDSNIAMLHVTFCGTDWNRIIPKLFLSKILEEALGETVDIQLPHFPPDNCLIDYVQEVKKCISGRINLLVQSMEKKREFVLNVVASQYSRTVEFDSIQYSYVSFLQDDEKFIFLVYIRLPPHFPREQPTIMLKSVYHMTAPNTPYEERINFPCKVQWDIEHMVQKLLAYIRTCAKKFYFNSITIYSKNPFSN